jgi:hypothetical protein
VNRGIQNILFSSAAAIALLALCGCALAIPPTHRLTRDDIKYAAEHGYAIVEAQVTAAESHALGTRSEGHGYSFRVLSTLLPATTNVSESFTYDYSKTPLLRPGRYMLILQPGPYYRAERLSSGSARLTELRQWTQRQ